MIDTEEQVKERHFHPVMPSMDAIMAIKIFISVATEIDSKTEKRIKNISQKTLTIPKEKS